MNSIKFLFFFIGSLWLFNYESIAQTPGTQKWAFSSGSSIHSSPAIASDGVVYVGSNDNMLYAVYPGGSQKWTYTTSDWIRSSPAIASDGVVYVGSDDNKLYAINPDGSQKWAFTTGSYITSSPTIASDGVVYVGSYDNKLYAINPDGSQKWAFTTGSDIDSSPAIASDGVVYVGSIDNKLYAINPDGSQKWAFTTAGSIHSSPAIASDGVVYVGSADNKLYALNADGSQKWAFATGSDIDSSPAIASDGVVYVGSDDNKLYAINPEGSLKWAFTTGSDINSSPAIGSDGVVYVGSDDYKLYAINPDGSQKWAFTTGSYIKSSPAIASDGVVYVASYDKKLYALNSSSNGLADSPWPKFHHNNQNTGFRSSLFVNDAAVFALLKSSASYTKSIELSNPFSNSITVQSCTLSDSRFSLLTALPLTIAGNSNKTLQVNIIPTSSAWLQSAIRLSYQNNGKAENAGGTISAGLFLDDGSETALTAKRALDAYTACKAKDADSYATLNNLGVLYRLLNQSALAEFNFMAALSKSINARTGFSGIKMNVGVVKSDQSKSSDATSYYDMSLQDVSSSSITSGLAPQVYYNKAWEAYRSKNWSEALTQVNKTIGHDKAGTLLTAKGYTLRGAIYFQQNNLKSAKTDWQKVLSLDPSGPIGNLAKYDMQFVTPIKIALRSGWNLVSWNVDTANDSTKALLKEVMSKVIVVLGYESGGKTYDPKLPNLSTLPFMDHWHGYWVKMSTADTLRLYGPVVDYSTTGIACESGWNLVSYLPSQSDSASHGFSSVINTMTVALGYNGAGQTFVPQLRSFSTLKVLSPYLGYWLKLNQSANLLYPQPLSGIKPAMMRSPLLAGSVGEGVESLSGYINPSNEWINVYGQNIIYQGRLLAIGTEVKAKDREGNECGSYTVREAGVFGFMAVYRDDPNSEVDEGVQPGEEIHLYFGSERVPVGLKWTEMGDVIDVSANLTGVESGASGAPDRFMLMQNHPNPFNPATTIGYQLARNVQVTLKVYNMLGQEIVTLLDEEMKAGYHQVVWDGRDQRGVKAGSGIYLYTLTAGEFQETKKMLLLF